MSKSSFHCGDWLYGILGLKVIQLFSVEAREPGSIWCMVILGFVVLAFWMYED